MKKADEKLLENKKLVKLFAASEEKKKKRGVAIYAKEALDPQLIYASEDGRILMVEIKRNQNKCLVVNLYAPNTTQENFYAALNCELIIKQYEEYCLMGDFNAVFDCVMDHKSKKQGKKSELLIPNRFSAIPDELNLEDAWRTRKSLTRDDTFFTLANS